MSCKTAAQAMVLLVCRLADEFHDLDLVGHVEVIRGLVEQQHTRLLHQGPADYDFLMLAARKLVKIPEGKRAEAQLIDDAIDDGEVLIGWRGLDIGLPAKQQRVIDRSHRGRASAVRPGRSLWRALRVNIRSGARHQGGPRLSGDG